MRIYTLLIILTFLLPACATKSQKLKSYQNGYNAADAECLELQKEIGVYVNALKNEMREKNKRLDAFNQLDDKGQIRNKSKPKKVSPCHENPRGPGCQDTPDGSEDWQK